MAAIRDKGHCPCPRCLIPKSKFHRTGFLTDLAARLSHTRTYLLDKIKLTRKALYVLGRPLKGSMVETLLKGESLVPTLVRNFSGLWCDSVNNITMPLRTLFANGYRPWDSKCSQSWSWTYCMSSSLAY